MYHTECTLFGPVGMMGEADARRVVARGVMGNSAIGGAAVRPSSLPIVFRADSKFSGTDFIARK